MDNNEDIYLKILLKNLLYKEAKSILLIPQFLIINICFLKKYYLYISLYIIYILNVIKYILYMEKCS